MTKIRRRRALSRARWRRARLADPRASAPAYDDDKRLLDIEIHAITTQGGWYGMLAFFGFVTITLMRVKDTDFFAYGAETTLPAIGVGVPTTAFFYIGALATSALYVYLHLHLARLWEMIAAAPAEIDGMPLAVRIYPTLMTEWAVAQRPDRGGATSRGMMPRLKRLAARALVWWAGPIVIGGFWVKSWPKHDLPMTLWVSACLVACVFIGFVSIRSAMQALQPKPRRRWLRRIWWPLHAIAVGLALIGVPALGAIKSKLGLINGRAVEFNDFGTGLYGVTQWLERNHLEFRFVRSAEASATPSITLPFIAVFQPEKPISWIFKLSRANLYRVQITQKPNNWRDQHIWIKEFRAHWCERETNEKACWEDVSEEQRAAFETEAAETRRAYIDDLNKVDLTCTSWLQCPDLRGANASEAFMPGVSAYMTNFSQANLILAQMQGADLRGAQMQGGKLISAQMQGASLDGAQMQWASVWLAQMQGANLSGAQMQGALFMRSQMQEANLKDAQMQGADLQVAQLQGASLRNTQMQGASLSGAQMQGAHFGGAQMQGADLSGTKFGPKPEETTQDNLETASNLTQNQLLGAFAFMNGHIVFHFLELQKGSTYEVESEPVLPRDAITGEQLWVLSCLTEFPDLPEGVRRPARWDGTKCAEGQEPKRLGTPTGTQSPDTRPEWER